MRSKFSPTLCFILTLFTLSATAVEAQEFQPFAGRGIAGGESTQPEPSFFQKLLGAKSPAPQKYSAPFSNHSINSTRVETKPEESGVFRPLNFDWLKPKDSSAEPIRPFSGLADLFPKRDPNEPTVIEKMNYKSKEFIDRTTSWAQEKNQALRMRTSETWSALTSSFRPSETASDSLAPPVRTANADDGSIKY